MTRAPRAPGGAPVALVVEQLRRRTPGGIGTYAESLARALGALPATARPAVQLIASRGPSDDPLASLGLPLRRSHLGSPLLTRAWAHGGRRLEGYRLVHATSFDLPPTRSPLVVTVHDLLWRRFPEAYSVHGRAWHEAALRRVGGRASAVVVPSAEVAEELLDAGVGLSRDQLRIIEEGSDHLPPADHEAGTALLERLGVAGPYLLSVGTLEPRKNLARLFAAYAAVATVGERPPLLCCGPQGWGSALPLGGTLPSDCHLLGRVAAPLLAALYERATALVFVPLGEGFGLPVAEAMHAGLPVVSSPVPAGGGAALEVDPLDVEGIAAAIAAVSSDEELRRRLRSASRRRAAELTWSGALAQHLELWGQVAGG